MNADELKRNLAQFNGTEQWYRHWSGLKFTDGVRFVAEHAGGGAFWLLDLAGSYHSQLAREPFKVWQLFVYLEEGQDFDIDAESYPQVARLVGRWSSHPGLKLKSALVVCDDGNGEVLVDQSILYTDFPLPYLKLYVCDGVVLLPSEY